MIKRFYRMLPVHIHGISKALLNIFRIKVNERARESKGEKGTARESMVE